MTPEFANLWSLWYVEGTKIVPAYVASSLDPIALAFWSMGDGGKCGAGFHLNTHAFGPQGAQLLIDILSSNFGLICKLHSRNRIYIPSDQMDLFRTIVSPHFLDGFRYKLI